MLAVVMETKKYWCVSSFTFIHSMVASLRSEDFVYIIFVVGHHGDKEEHNYVHKISFPCVQEVFLKKTA